MGVQMIKVAASAYWLISGAILGLLAFWIAYEAHFSMGGTAWAFTLGLALIGAVCLWRGCTLLFQTNHERG